MDFDNLEDTRADGPGYSMNFDICRFIWRMESILIHMDDSAIHFLYDVRFNMQAVRAFNASIDLIRIRHRLSNALELHNRRRIHMVSEIQVSHVRSRKYWQYLRT